MSRRCSPFCVLKLHWNNQHQELPPGKDAGNSVPLDQTQGVSTGPDTVRPNIVSPPVSNDSPNSAITQPVSNGLTRRLYFGTFGLVYLIAFLSLWSQVQDLIGSDGLLPLDRFFRAVHDKFRASSYLLLPSLLWLNPSDRMLNLYCGTGCGLSILLTLGIAPRLTLLLLWTIYLSLSSAGQDFLSFQWDTLLLEMTLCSWFYAPSGLRANWRSPCGRWASWTLWALAFKLMFLSGATKLLSGDTSWSDGTALEFHYYTQPIPSWPAWYAYQSPLVLHRLALFGMFTVEIALPFLVFCGGRGRAIFGVSAATLMVVIEATGNFGFFNLQTIVLCIPLLNDHLMSRFIPKQWQYVDLAPPPTIERAKWIRIAFRSSVSLLLFISLLSFVSEIANTARNGRIPQFVKTPIEWADGLLLSWGRPYLLRPLSAFRTINGYGLFRVMTTSRKEIVIETSDDGTTWTACEFPYKPGKIDRAPPIVAPQMPRLDWQMWFAALNLQGNQHWLTSLVKKILNGSPVAARLLGHPELTTSPPKYVRLVMYDYKFTSADQRRATGNWWNRSFEGHLTGAIQK